MDYYFSHDGSNRQGPVPADRLVASGVTAETLVWRDGMTDWQPAGRVPELAGQFQIAQPAPLVHPQQGYAQPQQAYAQPQAGYPQGQPQTVGYAYPNAHGTPAANGLAITAMILGIASYPLSCLYAGWLTAILAIVFGHVSRGQIARGQGSGGGMGLTGLILGYLYFVFVLLFVLLVVVFGVASSTMGRTGNGTY